MICVYANAVFGIILFEIFYPKVSRIQVMHSKYAHINKHFPLYRREDAKSWSRLKFWPGAMTVLIPRTFFYTSSLIFITLGTKIVLCGLKGGEPIKGKRLSCVMLLWDFMARWMGIFGTWTWFTHTYEKDVDYSEYLGPDSNPTTACKTDRAPTLVCNHMGA